MANTKVASESLHEALAHLNEVSKESREDLQKLVNEKYTDLRDAFGGAAQASAGWFQERGREVADKTKVTASAVDKHVRKYPWHYVGGAAAAGLLTGMLVGRRK
jgi:ElaB/YqjD/DUF883 family membrane-anchored ribosome-binding protein